MTIKEYLDRLEDLSNKKILVTGGTSGIGLSIVKHLLTKHAEVVVLARNLKKFEDVKNLLLKQFENAKLSCIQYDQSDDTSINQAVKEIMDKHADFYAIVLNAGIVQTKKTITYTDGYPTTIKTNFVGLHLFLQKLIPLLNDNKRFIFQGSLCAGWHIKKISTLKIQKAKMWQSYIVSKAGVEALFYHYSQIENSPHSFYLVEPGLTSTDIIRDFPSVIRQAGKVFLKVASHSPDKAALTALLALQTVTPNHAFIVPRGLATWMGYPKIKKFPKKRKKEYLLQLLEK